MVLRKVTQGITMIKTGRKFKGLAKREPTPHRQASYKSLKFSSIVHQQNATSAWQCHRQIEKVVGIFLVFDIHRYAASITYG